MLPFPICGILKKNTCTYVQNRNKLTDIENKLMVTRRERRQGGVNLGFRINRYTFLYI